MTENFENQIYKFPTSELPERYGIVRSVAYSRLDALQIKPIRQGNKSYITDVQLQLMDDLNTHLETGGRTDEFVQQCLANGRIIPAQTEALVTQVEAQDLITSHSQELTVTDEVLIAPAPEAQEEIEHLAAQKEARVSAEDLQEIDERSQYRAAAKVIGEETLTLLYESTEEFTIPGLKEQVQQHRERCKQARSKRTMGGNLNDFLSQSLLARTKAVGSNGSTGSASCNSNQSPTSRGDRATA